jgi:hypothetical protein
MPRYDHEFADPGGRSALTLETATMNALPASIRIYPEFAVARVACPHCGANKGEQCVSTAIPRTHWQRMDEAKAAVLRMIAEQGGTQPLRPIRPSTQDGDHDHE